MRLSRVRGRKVVTMDTAGTVGQLDGLIVDAAAAKVVALRLRRTRMRAKMLPWGDVHGFGDDAITVPHAGRIVETDPDLTELAGKSAAVLGKRVLSTDGVELGRVDDIDFDAATGDVLALVLPDGEIAGNRMLGAGGYAVVVRA